MHRKITKLDRINIVFQATGQHAWGVSGGWVNAAQKLGELNRVFSPKGNWGDLLPYDDDGLGHFLDSNDSGLMLLLGMDWHCLQDTISVPLRIGDDSEKSCSLHLPQLGLWPSLAAGSLFFAPQ